MYLNANDKRCTFEIVSLSIHLNKPMRSSGRIRNKITNRFFRNEIAQEMTSKTFS